MKKILTSALLMMLSVVLIAQEETKEKENIKKGISVGGIPTIAFNSDLGFQYGGLVTFHNYGDGTSYPKYKHMLRLEVSRFTKGSGANQIFFDSDQLFKKRSIRFTSDLSFLTEKALDFYGFNGAMTIFNPDFADDQHTDYISRMFYRMERRMIRFTSDFQGYLVDNKLKWLAGVALFDVTIGTVDIEKINKGKDDSKKLPDTTLLYDHYVNWGLINVDEAKGGFNQFIKTGLVYDTRDIEANPSKGIWAEALILAGNSFSNNKHNPYAKLILIQRQYFTLVPKRLSFVYRLGYMGTVAGKAPFYMQSYMFNSFSSVTIVEGLGGAKSLRGILRNRIVGDDIAYANVEFRWKFVNTVIAKQNIYLALNPFVDAGYVVNMRKIDKSLIPAGVDQSLYFSERASDKIHITYGCGLHIAQNENFVLSMNYGISPNRQNGKSGLYIGSNWLF